MSWFDRRRTRPAQDDVCHCGHPFSAHEHFRRGTDCGICGSPACARFGSDPQAAARESSTGAPTGELPDDGATAAG